MKQLNLKTEVHIIKTVKEFIDEFCVGENDIIFSTKVFDKLFNRLGVKAECIYYEDFGTGEPSDNVIEKIIEELSTKKFERIIAIGGGSVIDTAKILALANVKSILDLYRGVTPFVKSKKLIVVPTTCGTGSEVTNVAVVAFPSLHTKMGKNDDAYFPDVAVLIPELMKDLPYNILITSSYDALIHAVESFLSPKATAYTSIFSKEAINIILRCYKDFFENGKEKISEKLEELSIASDFAGIAFALAGCAGVHAMALPVGTEFHLAHGESTYLFLDGVLNFYGEKLPNGKIDELKQLFSSAIGCEKKNALIDVSNLMNELYPLKKLSEIGMKKEQSSAFAESIVENQQRLLVNNNVLMTKEDIQLMFERLY